jgi:hypothetical protein
MATTPFWRSAVLGTCWLAGAWAGAAEPERTVEWQELRPPVAAEVNPFATMSDEQNEALRQIVLGRLMQARGLAAPGAAERNRAEWTQQLLAQGIDADAVLAQREVLITQRRAAAEAGVAALDGQPVRLGGYLLPAELQGNQVTEFLLVPWVGACSHTPPPPPNQSVRVRSTQPYRMAPAYEPVWISGALRLRPQDKSVFVVDGPLAVRSTYAIDGATVISAQPADPSKR